MTATDERASAAAPTIEVPVEALGEQALDTPAIQALVHCMMTQRSIRAVSNESVDPRLVEFLVAMAGRAGSGGNRQPWRFVVVTDDDARARIGKWYSRGWLEYQRRGMATLPAVATVGQLRSVRDAQYLADHIAEAPVLIVPCYLKHPRQPIDFYAGGSIFPAVQNLLLAARAVGLAATLTTMQALSGIDADGLAVNEPDLLGDLREVLGVPMDVAPAAVIPVGWPHEPFRAGTRKDPAKMLMSDQWSAASAPRRSGAGGGA